MWSDWLVFCDCGFHSVCPLMDKDKRFMEASWWERLTERETGSCSDGCSVNLKSNFLLMGGAVFPPCYLTWGQTMVEVMNIMSTSFKRSHAHTATLSAPNPAAGHCWSMPSPETPRHLGQVWISLLWGHCSFLLGPGAHKVLFVPSKSLFSQSCVSFGSSMVGLMATFPKRAYAIPRFTASRASATAAGHCLPIPPQETFKHSSGSVSVWSLGPDAHKVCLSPPNISGGRGVWF